MERVGGDVFALHVFVKRLHRMFPSFAVIGVLKRSGTRRRKRICVVVGGKPRISW